MFLLTDALTAFGLFSGAAENPVERPVTMGVKLHENDRP